MPVPMHVQGVVEQYIHTYMLGKGSGGCRGRGAPRGEGDWLGWAELGWGRVLGLCVLRMMRREEGRKEEDR